jgi:hypothetical protein
MPEPKAKDIQALKAALGELGAGQIALVAGPLLAKLVQAVAPLFGKLLTLGASVHPFLSAEHWAMLLATAAAKQEKQTAHHVQNLLAEIAPHQKAKHTAATEPSPPPETPQYSQAAAAEAKGKTPTKGKAKPTPTPDTAQTTSSEKSIPLWTQEDRGMQLLIAMHEQMEESRRQHAAAQARTDKVLERLVALETQRSQSAASVDTPAGSQLAENDATRLAVERAKVASMFESHRELDLKFGDLDAVDRQKFPQYRVKKTDQHTADACFAALAKAIEVSHSYVPQHTPASLMPLLNGKWPKFVCLQLAAALQTLERSNRAVRSVSVGGRVPDDKDDRTARRRHRCARAALNGRFGIPRSRVLADAGARRERHGDGNHANAPHVHRPRQRQVHARFRLPLPA